MYVTHIECDFIFIEFGWYRGFMLRPFLGTELF